MTTLLIRNADILDPESGDVIEGGSIAIENDRIREVASGEIALNADRTLDAAGRTVMPGLIDCHVHAYLTTLDLGALSRKPMSLLVLEGAAILEGMLTRGFTTVRDAAGADWGLKNAVERGLINGPRLYIAGRALSQTGGHGDLRGQSDRIDICACGAHTSWLSHVVDGVPACLAATRAELRAGVDQVKIMASGGVASPADPLMSIQFSADEMAAIVGEARDWGTYAMAHAYSPDAINRALDAGVRTIEHGNFLDEETAEKMMKKDAFLVPTLVTYHTMHELGRQAGLPERNIAKTRDVLDAGLRSLEVASKAGVPMAFGTDLLGIAHAQQNREFEIRSEIMNPLELIRSATTVAAQVLREEGTLGVLREGARADVLVLDGDPLRDIAVLAHPDQSLRAIVKDGRVMMNEL